MSPLELETAEPVVPEPIPKYRKYERGISAGAGIDATAGTAQFEGALLAVAGTVFGIVPPCHTLLPNETPPTWNPTTWQ